MLHVEQIEDWLGQDVLDSSGERVGKLDDVYYADDSQEAVLAVLKSGLLGRRSTLAPLSGASVGRDHVKLAYSAEQIETAGGDAGNTDAISGEDAQRIGTAYGLQIGDRDLVSMSAISARREAAREAADRAASLEEEAARRAVEAEDAKGQADAATSDASQKAADAQQAKEEADRARAESERITPS